MALTSEERLQMLTLRLQDKLQFPEDKVNETVESTIRALWFAAIGLPVSSEQAMSLPLPDLNRQQTRAFYLLLSHRINNKPLAHITGRQNFMGLELICDYRALIPRKETEMLGQKALEISYRLSQQKHTVTVIDVCCGAGNLGIALSFFNSRVHAYLSDISKEAIDLTRENISFLKLDGKVQTLLGDMFEPFENEKFYGSVDLIVSNPPYISSAKVPNLPEHISAHEPFQAFDGGMMGIRHLRKLVYEAPRFLSNPGYLVFEVGAGQGPFVEQLCRNSGNYRYLESISDDTGIIRVIAGTRH